MKNKPTSRAWGFIVVIETGLIATINLPKSSPRTTVFGEGDQIGLD